MHRMSRSVFAALLLALAMVMAIPISGLAQTFRGGISGTVTDQSGAVVPGAQVAAVESATNTTYKTVSSSAGEFAFSNVPLGSYTVTVTANGFKSEKVDKVPVTAGGTYTLPIKLAVASAGETVEVTASSLSLDTVTDTQSTALPEEVVQNLPNSGRDFTQMLAQTPGFAGLSTGGGAGVGAVNGTRSNSVNWQIEGTDNNDLWWNIPAVNQGGVFDRRRDFAHRCDREFLVCDGGLDRTGPQLGRNRQPDHQVGHQQPARIGLLLQPQRILPED
jgi:hypothetical protein